LSKPKLIRSCRAEEEEEELLEDDKCSSRPTASMNDKNMTSVLTLMMADE
jgi:hypothetical protein